VVGRSEEEEEEDELEYGYEFWQSSLSL
jgi:hypothetical protein